MRPGETGFSPSVIVSLIRGFNPILFVISSGVITPSLLIIAFFGEQRSNIVDSRPYSDFPESIINSIFSPKES